MLCPEELPLLATGLADDAALTLRAYQQVYARCAIPHNGLVRHLRNAQ
ncbi:hypothetical protein SKUL_33 [Pseudomonas phage Skulduggery]|uniref:Uncharacterized protein n=1 Tax=Pseudomonas phage Skulduggery TaxID=2006671 RepID=A0A1Y0SUF0_9CAUD|nr:hypothetical protein PP627_gp33 [Pseudomonas phage Skulduggery]ARV77132.1 hypothetical protein SKUL_33 [Pseudomonas phage Skulduggery]